MAQLERYPLKKPSAFGVFDFVSMGPKGAIQKRIVFEDTEVDGMYNLAFGDYNPENEKLDDAVVTDNHDRDKVLATVVETVFSFLEANPLALIYAKGRDPIRTRLYQISINKYLPDADPKYQIFGEQDGHIEPFAPGINYDGFYLMKRKS